MIAVTLGIIVLILILVTKKGCGIVSMAKSIRNMYIVVILTIIGMSIEWIYFKSQ